MDNASDFRLRVMAEIHQMHKRLELVRLAKMLGGAPDG
jgi:hypothetical protein